MGKFKYRAFISCCAACRSSNTTLHKLSKNACICDLCKKSLEKNHILEMSNGGKLGIVKGTSQVVYLPPQEDKQETNKIEEELE